MTEVSGKLQKLLKRKRGRATFYRGLPKDNTIFLVLQSLESYTVLWVDSNILNVENILQNCQISSGIIHPHFSVV